MEAGKITAVQILNADLERVKLARAARFRAGQYNDLPPLWQVLHELIDQALTDGGPS